VTDTSHGVICDHLSVTCPLEHWSSLPDSLSLHLSDAQMELQVSSDHLYLWRTSDGTGMVRIERMSRAGVVSVLASGHALAKLRALGVWGRYLCELAALPHKVTRVDVACDVYAFAPTVIADALAKGRSGAVALTRKCISGQDVESHMSLRPDGLESGTVYFGSKGAEVRAAVYDKRLERYKKTSAEWSDVDERVRYEIRVRNGLPTLRDAYEPAALFFHHATPSLLPRPSGVPDWVPHGDGFSIERSAPHFPAMRLRSRVESSTDLGAICTLAARDGAGGVEFLLSCVRRRYDVELARAASSVGLKGLAPSVAAVAPPEPASTVVALRPQTEH